MEQNLSGIIERITFHNPDNGFAVLRVQANNRHDLVTVIGHLASANAGEQIEAAGEWVTDRQHGEQFKATSLRCIPPSTIEGIEKYLGSGLVKGVGPHYARRIVAVFGDRTLDVIDESPSFLREIKGIGPKRIALIRASWKEQKAVRSIMVFLQSYGVGTGRAVRIYKTYGDASVEIVRANPYRLATDIWGVGFKIADELAGRLGIDRHSPQRARAALRHVLREISNEGHVGYPEPGVLERAEAITEIPRPILAEAVAAELATGDLVREPGATDTGILYLKPLFLAEVGIAHNLAQLAQGDHPLRVRDLSLLLATVEARMGIQFAPSQREAIARAGRDKVLVVTGGPGVGKTTIVRGILEVFAEQRLRCALCAPTGRAAKRLGETTGCEAKTIHRLLEFDAAHGGFRRDVGYPLDVDLLVVDEVSMVDVPLMHSLLKALPRRACLVLVGDVDQLPSVGPGLVLGDIIGCGVVPVVRLTEIFRQAGQSWIVRAAHAIRQGEFPESAPPGEGDFYFVEADTPEKIIDRLITMLSDRIPRRFGLDPLRDVQILAPMNRSSLGVEALNALLQGVLNPSRGATEVSRFGITFRAGDKVLQTYNNYQREVFNGDIGRVTLVDEIEQEIVVAFEGREVRYDFGELDELAPAYALSIHRSQGSEYPCVIIPLHTQHYLMLQRNLLYTGLTRGKRLVVIVGSRRALQMAIQRQQLTARHSLLRERLCQACDAMVRNLPAPPSVVNS